MFLQTGYEKTNNNNNDLSHSNLSHSLAESERYVELMNDLDLVSRFCMPICCRDSETRELALDVISKTVEGWLDGVGSPRHYRLAQPESVRNRPVMMGGASCACAADSIGNTVNGAGGSDAVGNNGVPKEYTELVTLHLPILLRLSMSCPFVNVREKCHHILEIVKVNKYT